MSEDIAIERIRLQICDLLRRDTVNSSTVRVNRNRHVYTYGQFDGKVYLVLSGLIKLILRTPESRECLIDICASGEIFGELSLCGEVQRLRSAVAMQDSVVKQIDSRSLLHVLARESLLGRLAHYLGRRVAVQQEIITNLLTANGEQRLALTLLRLARTLGGKDPQRIRIPQRISHSELAKMIGTTRTRVSIFLKKFGELGLITLSGEHHLVVIECRLSAYLQQLSQSKEESCELTDGCQTRPGACESHAEGSRDARFSS